jgi:hypothetical protein
VLTDPDRREAEVELADVDGVERGIECLAPGVHHVLGSHRIVVELEMGHVVLRVDDVLHQPVFRMLRVRGEEDVTVLTLDVGAAAEDRHDPGLVAVADVVLAAVRAEAVAVRREHHVRGVDVGPVRLLGQTEREDRAVVEQFGRAAANVGVRALPDRPEPQDRDLPRVPVLQAVEGADLVEFADAGGVPALVWIAIAVGRRGQELGEQALGCQEVEVVRVPHALVVVLLEPRLAA